MDFTTKLGVLKSFAEEILTEEELAKLFETKTSPVAYDGFEPSGKIHIAQGLMRANNINKMLNIGCKFKVLVADWHAFTNNKLGGDMEKIHKAGEYMVEVWRACGLDVDKVEFVWGSDLVSQKEYWEKVLKIGVSSSVKRIVRCAQIMGRQESENLSAGQIFYPCMQAADIFHMGIDIAQLGMDQRKVNMLAREVGPKLGFYKPVAIHHHMLRGLTQINSDKTGIDRSIELKMSKSVPDSAIFMTDSVEDVNRKIRGAFCPEKTIEDNPVIEYCKYFIFDKYPSMLIERPQKFGGNIEFFSQAELEEAFRQGTLHPLDVKNGLSAYLNKSLEPVRQHFKSGKNQALLEYVNNQDFRK